jgi:glycosyltransferase involved in cell wall biosynthesis
MDRDDHATFHAVREVSLAAPAFNEAENLDALVEGWIEHLRSIPWLERFEIVICNDGSRDRTGAVLDELATRHAEVHPTGFARNQGAAAALSRAISCTSLDWVLLLDSDGQFPIQNLGKMVEAVTKARRPAAIGVRLVKADAAFARFGSWTSGQLCNLFHGTRYRDFNCALKLVRGPLLRALCLEAKGLNYSAEVTSKLLERGVQSIEVEIEHQPRTHGKSSVAGMKAALSRFLFVLYIGMRQLLLKLQVLQRPADEQ